MGMAAGGVERRLGELAGRLQSSRVAVRAELAMQELTAPILNEIDKVLDRRCSQLGISLNR